MLACLHTIQYLAILLCFSWTYLTKQCTHLIAKPADQCVSLAEKLCWHICRRWFLDSFFWCLEYSRPKVSTGCNLAEMNSFKLFLSKREICWSGRCMPLYAVYALFWGSSQMSCWCFGSQIACVQFFVVLKSSPNLAAWRVPVEQFRAKKTEELVVQAEASRRPWRHAIL